MDIEHIVKWHDWLYVVNWKGLWRICYGLIVRGVSGKYRYVTCRLIGKLFMLITATLLSTLILYHAHLTLVEPALFEWDVFEMAAPIQNPAKCEGLSVIWFLNTKGEHPYIGPSAIQSGPRAQRFPLVSSPKGTSRWEKVWWWWWGARRSHDVVQRAGGRLLWLWDTEAGSKT